MMWIGGVLLHFDGLTIPLEEQQSIPRLAFFNLSMSSSSTQEVRQNSLTAF
jgi:hypothetical protein